MKIRSALSADDYITAMQDRMEGRVQFGVERFTGFFAGPFFYVTHHAGHEFSFNRRITNQKNAAMGTVKQVEGGCEISFLRFRGALCPLVFLQMLSAMLIMCLAATSYTGYHDPAAAVWTGILCTCITAPFFTLLEAMTGRSEEGRRTLLSFLVDPSDPLANYHKIP